MGIGEGGVLGSLTVSAVAGVNRGDAGAASGEVNVAHQLGSSLDLAFTSPSSLSASRVRMPLPREELAHHTATTFKRARSDMNGCYWPEVVGHLARRLMSEGSCLTYQY